MLQINKYLLGKRSFELADRHVAHATWASKHKTTIPPSVPSVEGCSNGSFTLLAIQCGGDNELIPSLTSLASPVHPAQEQKCTYCLLGQSGSIGLALIGHSEKGKL